MLHAPDFLGYESAIEMAKDHRDIVQMGLKLKKVGNDIGTFLGGREIHPVNIKVGGFYKTPRKRDFAELAESLKWAADAAEKTVQWVSELPFPGIRSGLRIRQPVPPGRVSDERGADHLESRARHRRCRIRRPLRGRARPVYQCLALGAEGARLVLCRSDGALQPEFRPAHAAGESRRRRGRAWQDLPQSVQEHHRAQRRDPLRLRGGAAGHRRATKSPTPRRSMSISPARLATAAPRRRAACSTTATRSATMA